MLHTTEWEPKIARRGGKKKRGSGFQNIMKGKRSNAILPFHVDLLFLAPHPPPRAERSEACRRWWPPDRRLQLAVTGSSPVPHGWHFAEEDEAELAEKWMRPGSRFCVIQLLSRGKFHQTSLPSESEGGLTLVERTWALWSGSRTPLPSTPLLAVYDSSES